MVAGVVDRWCLLFGHLQLLPLQKEKVKNVKTKDTTLLQQFYNKKNVGLKYEENKQIGSCFSSFAFALLYVVGE
jgi:hypothetical protein